MMMKLWKMTVVFGSNRGQRNDGITIDDRSIGSSRSCCRSIGGGEVGASSALLDKLYQIAIKVNPFIVIALPFIQHMAHGCGLDEEFHHLLFSHSSSLSSSLAFVAPSSNINVDNDEGDNDEGRRI